MNPLLVILLAPAVAVLAMFAIPGRHKNAIRFTAWLGTAVSLAAAIYLFVAFPSMSSDVTLDSVDVSAHGHVYKSVVSVPWIEVINLQFKLGADGVCVVRSVRRGGQQHRRELTDPLTALGRSNLPQLGN